MDFLKSAVSSAISKGPAFAYSFADQIQTEPLIWSVYNGTKKEDGSKCTIFSFAVTPDRLPLARNAAQKLKTVRHPGVLRLLDTAESDRYVYVATERVTPLIQHIHRQTMSEDQISWGLRSVAATIKFLNENGYVHANVRAASVFVTDSGEWKLGGFELVGVPSDDDAVIYSLAAAMPDLSRFWPPEISSSGWRSLSKNPLTAVDSFGLGVLIAQVFSNGLTSAGQVAAVDGIPTKMAGSFRRLVSHNAGSRLSVDGFAQIGNRTGGFFRSQLADLVDSLDQLNLKPAEAKEAILVEMPDQCAGLSDDLVRLRVLPVLLHQAEYGETATAALATVIAMRARFETADWEATINPVLVRLFAQPDRQMRMGLLQSFGLFIDHLPARVVGNQIFTHWSTGFSDSEPVIREETVKSVLTILPKLGARTVNGDLLRLLARTANDSQEGIRTNTTICLGKIADKIDPDTRVRVLVAAFSRSLRDPFVYARRAGLMAISATAHLFSDADCAIKLLPAVCPTLVDGESTVRKQATKTFDLLHKRALDLASTLPESKTPPPIRPAAGMSSGPSQPDSQFTAQAAASWAGWAVNSFTTKLVSGAIAAGSAGPSSANPTRPSSTVPAGGATSSARPAVSPALSTPPPALSDDAGVDVDLWAAEDDGNSSSAPPQGRSSGKTGPTQPKTGTAKKKAVFYDDKGEPDFAGWLNAQKASKPLPQGLRKAAPKSTSAGVLGKKTALSLSSTAKTAPVKVVQQNVAAGPEVKAVAKPVSKPVEEPPAGEDEIDAWANWD